MVAFEKASFGEKVSYNEISEKALKLFEQITKKTG